MLSKTNAPRASAVVEVRGMPSRCRVMDAPGTTAPLGSNTVPVIGGDAGSPQTLAAKTASSTIAEPAPFTMPPRPYRDADTTAALPVDADVAAHRGPDAVHERPEARRAQHREDVAWVGVIRRVEELDVELDPLALDGQRLVDGEVEREEGREGRRVRSPDELTPRI